MDKLAAALAKAQGLVEGASKDKRNPGFNSKYADLAAVWEACREPLSHNGLSVVQFPEPGPEGTVGLRTILLHESGEKLESTFFMPVRDSKNPQAVGSAITYARRYALMAVVGIAPEDDDGNGAAAKGATKVSAPAAHTIDSGDRLAKYESLRRAAKGADGLKALYGKVNADQDIDPGQKQNFLRQLSTEIKGAQK
jgi:hypothetical protein